MKVFVFSYGTRGDVKPCISLAHAVQRAGHEVVVAGPLSSGPLAASYRVNYAPLDDGLSVLWDNRHTRQPGSRNGTRGLPALQAIASAARRPAIPAVHTVLGQAWAAARGADLIVHNGPLLASASSHIARRLGVPLVLSQMYPLFTPTKAFPTALYSYPGSGRLPGSVNRASYRGMLSMLRRLTSREVETWREQSLGLPPGGKDVLRRPDGSPVPVLNAVSRSIVTPPLDWPDHVHTTGYWLQPALPGWVPPADLASFLAAGPPPVYIGFGSMGSLHPDGLVHLAAAAVRRAGVRAVLACAAPSDGLDGLPPEVLRITEAPHDWLFPRMRAIVHHGGPGTAAAALAAGQPQVICPVMADQPFWGERMHRLGLAPAPIPRATLTAGELAAAIRTAVTDGLMRQRAGTVGHLVRADDGVAAAAAILEHVGHRSPVRTLARF